MCFPFPQGPVHLRVAGQPRSTRQTLCPRYAKVRAGGGWTRDRVWVPRASRPALHTLNASPQGCPQRWFLQNESRDPREFWALGHLSVWPVKWAQIQKSGAPFHSILKAWIVHLLGPLSRTEGLCPPRPICWALTPRVTLSGGEAPIMGFGSL